MFTQFKGSTFAERYLKFQFVLFCNLVLFNERLKYSVSALHCWTWLTFQLSYSFYARVNQSLNLRKINFLLLKEQGQSCDMGEYISHEHEGGYKHVFFFELNRIYFVFVYMKNRVAQKIILN